MGNQEMMDGDRDSRRISGEKRAVVGKPRRKFAGCPDRCDDQLDLDATASSRERIWLCGGIHFEQTEITTRVRARI
jgi:hypothetical protein